MDENSSDQRKPPYLSFSTLKNLLTELGSKPLPPQIDRSVMTGRSGGDQSYLLGALKFFGFIDEKQNVLDLFVIWAGADEPARKEAFARLLQDLYPNQMAISRQNGTQQKLLESFTTDFNYGGETRRKAMTFFLQCASWAGVDLSVHFKVNKVGSKRTTVPRGKRTPRKKPPTQSQRISSVTGQGERLSVSFGEAGSVDIQVRVSWMKLDDSTFTGLRTALNDIQALGAADPSTFEDDDEDESDGAEETNP
jgi:hypothetical protein